MQLEHDCWTMPGYMYIHITIIGDNQQHQTEFTCPISFSSLSTQHGMSAKVEVQGLALPFFVIVSYVSTGKATGALLG